MHRRLILSFMPGSPGGLLTVTSPAVHFAPIHSGRSRTKKVLSKLFSLFFPFSILLEGAGTSTLCLVNWNAFDASVTLKTHQHVAQGKVGAGLRLGTSSVFGRISHSRPGACQSGGPRWSLTITDTQLIRGTEIILIWPSWHIWLQNTLEMPEDEKYLDGSGVFFWRPAKRINRSSCFHLTDSLVLVCSCPFPACLCCHGYTIIGQTLVWPFCVIMKISPERNLSFSTR